MRSPNVSFFNEYLTSRTRDGRWATGEFYLVGVAVLPGVRWLVATGFLNEEIHKLCTFEA